MGNNTTIRRAGTITILAFLLTSMAATGAAAPPAAKPGELLVVLKDGADVRALASAGVAIERILAGGSIAQVEASDVAAAKQQLLRNPAVAYVTPNQPLRLAGASPDGMQYEASTWDASTWDASTWDASTWDASTWDASTWDASTWDASTWDASTWDASTWDASTWDANGTMDSGYDVQWGLGATRTPAAWNVTYGTGAATVCILDTGVDHTHPDLQVNLLRDANGSYGYNAMNGTTYVMDDHGHGTHVTGILAATGGNGLGITGVARSKVLVVKVMDSNGGTEADLIAGIEHCISRGADVLSMSLHVDQADAVLADAIADAQAAGMVVVAAAGNAGSTTIPYPAAYSGVLAVGAVLPNGTLAGYSNRGSDLDLVAPGYRIASTALGGGYKIGSGTSQAVPFVAGAAALIWEKNATLTASQVSGLLTSTARDLGASGFDSVYGHGALDTGDAVTSA